MFRSFSQGDEEVKKDPCPLYFTSASRVEGSGDQRGIL